MKRERGFALLIVLWSLVLITLLTIQILASGRSALALAGNIRAAAAARAAADGAISEAVYHVLAYGPDHWAVDGAPHVLNDGPITLTVSIVSLGGKINPNLASTALLTGLFQSAGAAPGQANVLANAVIAWRSPAASKSAKLALRASYQRAGLPFAPPGANFADLSDLSAVLGMTPNLLQAVLPELSLYQSGDPDPKLADPLVRRALTISGQKGTDSNAYTGNAPVVEILAEAGGPGQLAIRRLAIVSIPGANAAVPYNFLSLTNN